MRCGITNSALVKILLIHILQLLSLTMISPCDDRDVYVLANSPFTFSCECDDLKDLKIEGTFVKEISLHHNGSHVIATHPGLPISYSSYKYKFKWKGVGNCTCNTTFYIVPSLAPAKPKLNFQKVEYYNYETIKLTWINSPRDDIGINRSYALFQGLNSSCSDPNYNWEEPVVSCSVKLKVASGTQLVVRLVATKDFPNGISTSDYTLNLDEYVVPGPVKNFSIDSSNPSKPVLSWDPPYTEGILKYSLKYSSLFQLNHKVVNVTNQTSVTLTDICPNATYSFSITAHSLNHSSTAVHKEYQMPCDVPGQVQVTNNSYELSGDKDVLIYWKLYLCQYGCTNLQLKLNLYKITKSNEREWVRTIPVSEDARSVRLPDLQRSSTHHVTITATNQHGTGASSDVVVIPASNASKPGSRQPPNFTVIWNTHFVNVSWEGTNDVSYTVYVCINDTYPGGLVNSTPGHGVCSKIFWKEVGQQNSTDLKICSDHNSNSNVCTKGVDFCQKEQECIPKDSQAKTKIGIAFNGEKPERKSPIMWAPCIYDNNKDAEVPDVDVKPKAKSVVLVLPEGVSPCKKLGCYMHTYIAKVSSVNDTSPQKTKLPIKVRLNREENVYEVKDLQSSHKYNIELFGFTSHGQVKLKTLNVATEAEPERLQKALMLKVAPGMLAGLVFMICVFISVSRVFKKRRKQKAEISKVKDRDFEDLSSSDSDLEDPDESIVIGKKAGEYDIMLDGEDTTIPLNGDKEQLEEKDNEADSAMGGTLSSDRLRQTTSESLRDSGQAKLTDESSPSTNGHCPFNLNTDLGPSLESPINSNQDFNREQNSRFNGDIYNKSDTETIALNTSISVSPEPSDKQYTSSRLQDDFYDVDDTNTDCTNIDRNFNETSDSSSVPDFRWNDEKSHSSILSSTSADVNYA